jgi:hypothetical protein
MNDLSLNWAPSVRDQRWKASANFVWDTPWWGIGFSGAFRYYTGSVYNPILSTDVNGDTVNNTDRPTIGCANPAACTLGEGTHLGRNSFHAPEQHFLDLRLGKSFNVVSGRATVFAECFNCTNAANRSLGGVTSVWSAANSNTPQATFGQYTTYGDPRTWQVAARFDF